MALIACPECQRQVSDTAIACPGCGAPISSLYGKGSRPQGKKPLPIKRITVLVLIGLLLVGGLLFQLHREEQQRARAFPVFTATEQAGPAPGTHGQRESAAKQSPRADPNIQRATQHNPTSTGSSPQAAKSREPAPPPGSVFVQWGQCKHAIPEEVYRGLKGTTRRVEWDGPCKDGLAHGVGVTRVYNDVNKVFVVSRDEYNRGVQQRWLESYRVDADGKIRRNSSNSTKRNVETSRAELPPWATGLDVPPPKAANNPPVAASNPPPVPANNPTPRPPEPRPQSESPKQPESTQFAHRTFFVSESIHGYDRVTMGVQFPILATDLAGAEVLVSQMMARKRLDPKIYRYSFEECAASGGEYTAVVMVYHVETRATAVGYACGADTPQRAFELAWQFCKRKATCTVNGSGEISVHVTITSRRIGGDTVINDLIGVGDARLNNRNNFIEGWACYWTIPAIDFGGPFQQKPGPRRTTGTFSCPSSFPFS